MKWVYTVLGYNIGLLDRCCATEEAWKQDFTATDINQKWCTDITYIYTVKDVWTSLASVMDFYRRKIIGWAYDTTMTDELALKSVENACIESFHSVLKKEEVNVHTYLDSKSAYNAVFEY